MGDDGGGEGFLAVFRSVTTLPCGGRLFEELAGIFCAVEATGCRRTGGLKEGPSSLGSSSRSSSSSSESAGRGRFARSLIQ